MYNETMDDTKIEEYLEDSTVQDDYKKLKQENESYRQQLHVLRRKLQTSDALEKEFQDANEALENLLAQSTAKTEEMLAEREERYKATREVYEDQIASLEKRFAQKVQEISELQEEIRKYKALINEPSLHNVTSNEDNLASYKEKIKELTVLLENERDKQNHLEDRLAYIESKCQQLENIMEVIKEQVVEKDLALEAIREELAMKHVEMESLKPTSANACKGNSLFAEVEDRRQILLDKMKVLQEKYNEVKIALNKKTSEIKILKTEKASIIRKWETDTIDTLQENANLLHEYKTRIFELENKLKIEMKRNNQVEEQTTDSSFNYAQSLLATKKKELEQLNEKLEKQSIELLTQKEVNHDTSKQLRYWRSKAMSIEAQILAMKAQLEIEPINDNNKTLLEAIENFTITDSINFEKICDVKVT